MESIKLKKCPFCGGEAKIVQTDIDIVAERNSVRFGFSIKCRKCDATAPKAYGSVFANLLSDGLNIWHDDRESAIKEWNKRAKNNEHTD